MAKKEITNFQMTVSEHGNHSVSCEYNGARYHMWIDRDTLTPASGNSFSGGTLLFKNPPLNEDGSHKTSYQPGYFRTLRIAIDGETGRMLVPAMLAEVPTLLPIALSHMQAKLAEEKAATNARMREHRMEQNCRELYGLVLEAMGTKHGFLHAMPGAWQVRAEAVKAKIEGEA